MSNAGYSKPIYTKFWNEELIESIYKRKKYEILAHFSKKDNTCMQTDQGAHIFVQPDPNAL